MSPPLIDRPAYRSGYVAGWHWGAVVGFLLGASTAACTAALWHLAAAALGSAQP